MNHPSIVRIIILCIALSCALLTACADSAGEVYDGLGEQEGVGVQNDPQADGGNDEISVASDMGKSIGGATDNLQTNGGNASGSSESSIVWDVAAFRARNIPGLVQLAACGEISGSPHSRLILRA